ncbi:MAG: YigZ family protein [Flavobacteriales bacterium]
MSVDRYLTLATVSIGERREKASRFIAHAFPISDEDDFKEKLAAIAKDHHSARHICFAWVLGETGDRFRAFDAGEPSGSAGKPMLRQLQGRDLTHSAIITVRYFGGTLLGQAGLARAFSAAAQEAIANNAIIERIVFIELIVHCSYAEVEALRQDVLLLKGEVLHADFLERCVLRVAVPRGCVEECTERWRRYGLKISPLQEK